MSSIFVFLFIILVKLEKVWLSKILGMTYNLGWREYFSFTSVTRLHMRKMSSARAHQVLVPPKNLSGQGLGTDAVVPKTFS